MRFFFFIFIFIDGDALVDLFFYDLDVFYRFFFGGGGGVPNG